MKKVKLKIPINLENALIDWLIAKQITVVFSYLLPGEFFEPSHLVLILTIEETKTEDLKDWIKYAKPLN